MENQPQDVMYALGHIQSSMEGMGKKLDDFITEAKSGFKDHDHRITNLERNELKRITIATTLGTVGGAVAGFLLKVFFHV